MLTKVEPYLFLRKLNMNQGSTIFLRSDVKDEHGNFSNPIIRVSDDETFTVIRNESGSKIFSLIKSEIEESLRKVGHTIASNAPDVDAAPNAVLNSLGDHTQVFYAYKTKKDDAESNFQEKSDKIYIYTVRWNANTKISKVQ
jgi:hypothetical protein